MIGLRVNEQWIDLYPNTRIQIKRNTDLYVTGDPEFASNSYSLPFSIPATPRNKISLKYSETIETVDYQSQDIKAIIYAGEGSSIGLPMFEGTLYVKKGVRAEKESYIEAFIVVDGLNNFTSVKMSDLSFPLYQLDTKEDMADHAKDTVENPDDYDYIFAQILNPTFNPSRSIPLAWNTPEGLASKFTNYYDKNTEVFPAGSANYVGLVMTPFYKTHVLFKKIVEYMGYNIVDNFHTLDIELERLLFFNNQNMYKIVDGEQHLDTVIDGTRHMIDNMPITEFVKRICRYFCLGIFVDNAQKKIEITPFKNILSQPDAANWTDKTSPSYEIDKSKTELPIYIGFKTDSADEMSQLATYKDISEYGTAVEYFLGPTPFPSFLYFARVNQYWYLKAFQDYLLVTNHFERIFTGGQGSPVELSASPLLMNVITQISQREEPFDRINFPQVGIPGKGEYLEQDDEENWTLINTQANNHEDVRLFFYRGPFNNDAGRFLQSGITATDEETQTYAFQYSLLFNGPNSVYDLFWKEWIYFMQHKKIVNRILYLKLSDILSFREYHKIRIGGLSYFVKSMDITLTMQGIEPVQAELVSIPMS